MLPQWSHFSFSMHHCEPHNLIIFIKRYDSKLFEMIMIDLILQTTDISKLKSGCHNVLACRKKKKKCKLANWSPSLTKVNIWPKSGQTQVKTQWVIVPSLNKLVPTLWKLLEKGLRPFGAIWRNLKLIELISHTLFGA